MKTKLWPKMKRLIPGDNVLILAPHMDDEVIGCGGIIQKFVRNKIPVSVIYTTLGDKDMQKKLSPEELHIIRRHEAKKSAEILGINNLYFLNNHDGSELNWEDDFGQLFQLLDSIRPDLVFLPYYGDSHPDHIKTNIIFQHCIAKGYQCNVAAYEVWSLILWPNILIDISAEMDNKLKAIQEHQSQMKYLKYDKLFTGINQYRAAFYFFQDITYAEAFYYSTAEQYFNEDYSRYMKGLK